MLVALDMDEIITDFHTRFVDLFRERTGVTLPIEKMEKFNLEEFVAPIMNIDESLARTLVDGMIDHRFYDDVKPIEGALDGILDLSESHDVIIVTAIPRNAPGLYEGKVAWMKRYMPWFDRRNLVCAYRKYLVSGDVLFDDGTHNLESWRGYCSIAMDRPWNQDWKGRRVKDWKGFIDSIDEVVEEINKLIEPYPHPFR